MQLDFIWTLLISLGLTLALELIFCFAVGLRGSRNLTVVILVNILTNPPIVLLNYILGKTSDLPPFLIITVLEMSAVLVEGLYYRSYGENIKHPFALSFCANAFSFLTVLIINHIV